VISGPILDLQWSDDSKRIIAVGEGREKYAVAFMWDTGASVGDLSGHQKTIMSCDIKQTRPYRVATGGEDLTVNWFEGPPFKFHHSMKDHTRFVNCVRFSPDGNLLVTVGSDKTGFLYDGKTGEKLKELSTTNGHTAGIYSASWSKDSKQILTASADKTAKIFNADNGSVTTTFNVFDKPGTDDQLLGSLWQGDVMAVVALSSDIILLDPTSPNKPKKVIKGHNKFIGTIAYDQGCFYTSDFTARIIGWNAENADTFEIQGNGHNNMINRILVQGDKLVTSALDDSIRFTSIKDRSYGNEAISFDSAPRDIAVGKKDKSLVIVVLKDSVVVVKNGKVASKLSINFEPSSVALSIDEVQVAVGGKDNLVHLYSLSGDKLSESGKLTGSRGTITTLEYSPNGQQLATGDTSRDIFIWDVAKKEIIIKGWQFHNAKINRLAWAPDGIHLASCGLDGFIFVWNIQKPDTHLTQKDAHKGGVNDLLFVSNNLLASVGQDCALKTWTITY